jgi:hypothetical protein
MFARRFGCAAFGYLGAISRGNSHTFSADRSEWHADSTGFDPLMSPRWREY